jgi:pimeloyl-ACP methyl ester carboxylesterase
MAVARSRDSWINWRSEGEGEPVLIIMGLAGSSRAWFRLLPHVACEYRAIVFDHRGTGDSDRVGGPLKMRDLVDDTLAVLDAAEVETAHVIGVSMGGMIAQQLALDHPERVRSLLLGCTTPGGGGTPSWRLLVGTALRPLLGAQRMFPILAPALYAERTRREHPDRVQEDLAMRLADATPVRTSYAQMAAIAGHDTRARLRELAGIPVTVLHGLDDTLVPVRHGRALAEGIPGARLVELSDCGHILTTDAEEAVVGAVLHHLKTCAELSPLPA